MNSKKNLVVGVIIIAILIVGAILWKGGFLGQSVEIAQQGIATISNKITDDIYVEISAQSTLAGTQVTSTGTLNQTDIQGAIKNKMSELLKKYNINDVEFGMYVQALYNDKIRLAELDKKISQRLSELQKTGK